MKDLASLYIYSKFRMIFWASMFFFFISGCGVRNHEAQKGEVVPGGQYQIGFYNVENLFDTINDPFTADEDFTPSGKLEWNSERYRFKLEQLTKVILAMNMGRGPDILGLCEVENKSVVQDLCKVLSEGGRKYSVIHQDSPDERGIDVALIYDPLVFVPLVSEWLPVILDNASDPSTRDILYVNGKLNGTELDLFVNHWPSRGGGQVESEPNRIKAAGILRNKVEEVISKDKDSYIVCMGDFNDYPTDRSISEVLGAGTVAESGVLYNMMGALDMSGQGSYNYKGDWGTLDQFMVTRTMLNKQASLNTSETSAFIFKEDWFLYKKEDGTEIPNRTYAGPKYTGGYSDHLPIGVHLSTGR